MSLLPFNSHKKTVKVSLYCIACFPVNFAKFLRTPFFYRIPPVAASIELDKGYWWLVVVCFNSAVDAL